MALKQKLQPLGNVHEDDRWLILDDTRTGDSLDSEFADSVADMVRHSIGSVTPVVNTILEGKNEERDKPG